VHSHHCFDSFVILQVVPGQEGAGGGSEETRKQLSEELLCAVNANSAPVPVCLWRQVNQKMHFVKERLSPPGPPVSLEGIQESIVAWRKRIMAVTRRAARYLWAGQSDSGRDQSV
jgi:hypothetical protein